MEAAVRSLEHSIGVFTWCLLGSTFVVSLGLILEYWHPVSEFIDELKWPMSVFRWPKFMEIAGGILVTIGVLGEFGFTLEVFVLEGRLEQANHTIRDTLTAKLGEADQMAKTAVSDSSTALRQAKDSLSKAGAAEASLGKAETEAKNAQTASASALTMAGQARKEADSFEADIKSAKEQAAAAESHLTDALKQAADATAELQRLKSPRSLVEVPKLIADLSVFKGTEYRLNVFQDDESIQFTKIVDDALNRAGWLRKPSPYKLGIPSLLVFGKDREQAVPICIATGIQIYFWAEESLAVLNARPFKDQSPTLQAAFALRAALVSRISPQDNGNVGDKVTLDEHSEDKFPLVICIGKKP